MLKSRSEACAGNGVQTSDRTHQASAIAAAIPAGEAAISRAVRPTGR